MRPASAVELRLRAILESDRAWSAYALADLFPPWNAYARWIVGARSAVLIYRGLEPPILFAHGDPIELDRLFTQLPPGDYWFTLRPTDYSRLAPRLEVQDRARMWRMCLQPSAYQAGASIDADRRAGGPPALGRQGGPGHPASAPPVERLGAEDLPALEQLYRELPDGPDAFSAEQLDHGIYFGIRSEQRLLSMAGTHVVNHQLGVAALGNVATQIGLRGRGLGRAVTQAVIDELVRERFETIVLNVRMDNEPAVQLYRNLGFMPYCGFYEGRGTLA